MLTVKYVSGMFLLLMGFMDCLTTVVGAVYFKAEELNPLLAGLVNSSLPVFVALKLLITGCATATFVLFEKTLLASKDKTSSQFHINCMAFRVSSVFVIVFLCVVVINNVAVILSAPL